MNYRFFSFFVLLPISLLLGACGGITCGDAHAYQDSTAIGPLKAPPGVTLPAPDPAYVIPGVVTATRPQSLPCMIKPPELIPAAATGKKPEAAKPAVTAAATVKAAPAASSSHGPAGALPSATTSAPAASSAPAAATHGRPSVAAPRSME